jgi:predicted PurR-regulated permease PerM
MEKTAQKQAIYILLVLAIIIAIIFSVYSVLNKKSPQSVNTVTTAEDQQKQLEIAAFVETSKVLTEPGDQLKKHEDIREILDKAIAELKAATNGQNPKE